MARNSFPPKKRVWLNVQNWLPVLFWKTAQTKKIQRRHYKRHTSRLKKHELTRESFCIPKISFVSSRKFKSKHNLKCGERRYLFCLNPRSVALYPRLFSYKQRLYFGHRHSFILKLWENTEWCSQPPQKTTGCSSHRSNIFQDVYEFSIYRHARIR